MSEESKATPSVMAIISKAVFEKQARGAMPGTVVPIDRYNSANKALEPLRAGGRLFMVTVRPEGEALWLVGILEGLTPAEGAWVASSPNATPIVDISKLRSQLRFESGKGIVAKPGALGMSLQTPRVLAASDVALLLAAAGGSSAAPPKAEGGEPSRRQRRAAGSSPAEDLLRAVLETPEDDAPRLVFADWLQEHGDPRGELISVQCMLAAGPEYPAQRNHLRETERDLLKTHGDDWAARAKPIATSWVFRRGFIDQVTADAKKFLGGAQSLFDAEPVLRLELAGVTKPHCAALAAAPWLARLRQLKLRGAFKDAGVSALVGSSHLAGLTVLNLGSCGVGAGGAGVLATARIQGLQALSLSGNPVRDAGLAALLGGPLLGSCSRLYLARCGLTDVAVTRIASEERLSKLTCLCLGGNAVTDAGAKALAESPHLGQLKRLELAVNDLSKPVQQALKERFGSGVKLEYSSGYADDGDGGDYDDE